MNNLSIAFDFDGTLSIGQYEWPNTGIPNIELIEAAKRFQSKGWIVILYTARQGEHLQIALDFLKKYGFIPDYCNENIPENIAVWGDKRKVITDYYVDDRNISFNDAIAMSYRED